MVTGLGLLALPVGIIATGFIETIHRRDFVVTFGMLARVPLFRDFAPILSEILNLLRSQSVARGGIIAVKARRRGRCISSSRAKWRPRPHHKSCASGRAISSASWRCCTRPSAAPPSWRCRIAACWPFGGGFRPVEPQASRAQEAHRGSRPRAAQGARRHEGDLTQSEVASAGKIHDWFREDD